MVLVRFAFRGFSLSLSVTGNCKTDILLLLTVKASHNMTSQKTRKKPLCTAESLTVTVLYQVPGYQGTTVYRRCGKSMSGMTKFCNQDQEGVEETNRRKERRLTSPVTVTVREEIHATVIFTVRQRPTHQVALTRRKKKNKKTTDDHHPGGHNIIIKRLSFSFPFSVASFE